MFPKHVSMHLLVLSAFRPDGVVASVGSAAESQCTFWCSVLSDVTMRLADFAALSQCTFWCSVLSD